MQKNVAASGAAASKNYLLVLESENISVENACHELYNGDLYANKFRIITP